jgi:hypothetical protein
MFLVETILVRAPILTVSLSVCLYYFSSHSSHIHPEDEGRILLRNVGKHLTIPCHIPKVNLIYSWFNEQQSQ